MTLAERVHDNTIQGMRLDGELHTALLAIFGADPDNVDSWPFDDIKTDYYDNSVEMMDAKEGFEATVDQEKKVYELGFSRFWINYVGPREERKEKAYCKRENIA